MGLYIKIVIMSLTLARSERVQILLTHANLFAVSLINAKVKR